MLDTMDTLEIFEVGDSDDAVVYDLIRQAGYVLEDLPECERIKLELEWIGWCFIENEKTVERQLELIRRLESVGDAHTASWLQNALFDNPRIRAAADAVAEKLIAKYGLPVTDLETV